MLERLACPACNGGGSVAHTSGRLGIGPCRRCDGTGKESDEDYTRRLQSYTKPVAA